MRHLPLLLAAALVLPASAEKTPTTVEATVVDQKGRPVEGAVVWALEETGPTVKSKTVTMEMKGMDFAPGFLAVTVGDSVSFPNRDTTHHHVYSFSPLKIFEIPLYKGVQVPSVVFDQLGAVKLGCNIHDWMSAYVYVVETDKVVVTDTFGAGAISNLDNGQYEVLVWHPKLDGSAEATAQTVTIDGSDQSLSFTVNKKQMLRAWRAPRSAKRREY